MIFGIRGGLPVAAALSVALGIGSLATSSSAAELNEKYSVKRAAIVGLNEMQVAQDADPMKGLRAFIRCRACHTIGEGEPHRVGPNLHGVAGRTAGTTDFKGYSDAMKASGIVWNDDELSQFLAGPAKYLEGTKMKFPGAKPTDIPHLIAYLKQAGG